MGMKDTDYTESTYSYTKSLDRMNGSNMVSVGDGLTAASQFQNLDCFIRQIFMSITL